MPSTLPLIILFAVSAGLMTASALFTPKGPNQVTIRTGLMLTFACCYLIWAITYLAQLHPLMVPQHVAKE
ncbi:ATPase, V0 complex, subunit E1/e2 [Crepidotus variabilis]|uniref:ATPase, V0 complex, subunit E1/e2 n=1 Tax=Crepidotus variabilis TaxID=179855 RepID=A0A9P6EQ08_9AGAR|nr:ATPase, V0 complex, subunit E1/e2 [Crepidotus variabilis]